MVAISRKIERRNNLNKILRVINREMTVTLEDQNQVLVIDDGTTIDDITHALFLVKSHREKYREKHKKRYIPKRVPKEPEPEPAVKRPRGRPRKIIPDENPDENHSG